jgi:hypothetical protein
MKTNEDQGKGIRILSLGMPPTDRVGADARLMPLERCR